MRRRLLATALTLLSAMGAGASGAVVAQPNDPLTGFPFAYRDTDAGFAVSLCMDGDANRCIGSPVPHPADPYAVPDNFTPDEEAFWWRADAIFPPPFDKGLAEFAQEAAFATPGITAGQQVAFTRIRYRFQGLKANGWYRIVHPFGQDDVQARADGLLLFTEDSGCIAPPCNFATAPQGRITSYLYWDPSQAPAAPTGFIGDPLVEHAVVGSPIGRNSVTLHELSGQGGSVVATLTSTTMFGVMGKLAGPPPPPQPLAIIETQSLTFDPRPVDELAPAQVVTIRNRGVVPLVVSGAALSGTDVADFGADMSNCAAPVAPGGSCAISVGFQPTTVGARGATLTITHNGRTGGGSKVIGLAGTGTPAQPVKIRSARFVKGYGLRKGGGMSLGKFRAKGIDLVLDLEPGTTIVRVRVIKLVRPARAGRPVRRIPIVTEFVTPVPGGNGKWRAKLNTADLQKQVGNGGYRVQIVPVRRLPRLGVPTVLAFKIDHI